MKKVFVKGHPLTENESKEVKGGAWYAMKVVSDPFATPEKFPCTECGYEIDTFLYKPDEKTYYAVCDNCGCSKEVKMEE